MIYDDAISCYSFYKNILINLLDKNNIKYNNICCVGSLRRKKEKIGDIDICIEIVDNIENFDIANIINNANIVVIKKCQNLSWGVRIYDANNKKIDILTTSPSNHTSVKLFFTGSRFFNKYMTKELRKINLLYTSRGIKDSFTNEYLNFKSEREIFDLLNIDYIEPFDRSKQNYDI